jgi:putative membrane protein
MRKASKRFSDEQRNAVTQVVAEAEGRTSAEIVPVVAAASGRYDRAEDIVGLWTAVGGLVAVWLALPPPPAESGSWGGIPDWAPLLLAAAAVVAGFVVGAALASRVGWLRHLFTPRRQMRDEVAARARAVFFDSRVHHTAGDTGLLLYVSLYERMAVILADRDVVEKLGQSALDELCNVLTGRLRELHPADALCQTIRLAGERLASVLPRAADDVNELSDALVILDG